jgi:ankyrin repeat protein
MLAWLLEHGADPNRQCSIDLTPLSYVVADALIHIIQTLLKCGGAVQKGELLQHAIDRQADVVEVPTLLIQNGAPLDRTVYPNHHWSWWLFLVSGLGTPLHTAAKLGNMDAVRFLFSQEADTNIRDWYGRTAVDWATQSNQWEVVMVLEDAEVHGKTRQ